jgi:hypothetical protein
VEKVIELKRQMHGGRNMANKQLEEYLVKQQYKKEARFEDFYKIITHIKIIGSNFNYLIYDYDVIQNDIRAYMISDTISEHVICNVLRIDGVIENKPKSRVIGKI